MTDILKKIEALKLNTATITDPQTKTIFNGLLNLIEKQYTENEHLKEENQKLKNEINHLKGEQGKPDIKKKNRNDGNIDYSSEKERKDNIDENEKKKGRNREAKLPKVTIDREVICQIDKETLPKDIVFKGYRVVIVQDIKISTDNVKYRRAIYYSPSTGKTYTGELPKEVKGEFGVGVRSLIPLLKTECNMTESGILGFFGNFGIYISSAYISNQWRKGYESFHQEKSDIYQAGLLGSRYQQIDDTSARVKGENHYTQIVCNPLYTAYFTTEKKDRLTVLDVFRNFAPRVFLYNQQVIELLEGFNFSKKMCKRIDTLLEKDTVVDEESFEKQIEELKLGVQHYARLKEACAIAEYHSQSIIPVIETIVCDDAPQFKRLTPQRALSWIHDGRHYKKLRPVIPLYQKELEKFLEKYWLYYHKLKEYKEAPESNTAILLTEEFEELFSTITGYEELDDRISKTINKKQELLLVLKHPELPLHNNDSELAARVQVRDRDVSLHTMSDEGTKIKDTFMTISQTAKKLGVSTYEYIRDRVSGEFKMPSLADVMRERSLVS